MRNIGRAALVIVALLALVSAASLLGYPISVMSYEPLGASLLIQVVLALIPAGVTVLLAYYLITNRDGLAERWFPDEPIEVGVEPETILRLGIILLGIGLVAQQLPILVSTLTAPPIMALQMGDVRETFGTEVGYFSTLPHVLANISTAGIGLWMVTRSLPLSQRIWSMRSKPSAEPLATCPSCGAPFDPRDYEGAVGTPLCTHCHSELDTPRT